MAHLILIIFNLLIIITVIATSYVVPMRWLEGFYGVVIVPFLVTIATTMIIQTILFAVQGI